MEDAHERLDHAPIPANAEIIIAWVILDMSHSPADWLMRTGQGYRAQKSRIRRSISSIVGYFNWQGGTYLLRDESDDVLAEHALLEPDCGQRKRTRMRFRWKLAHETERKGTYIQ